MHTFLLEKKYLVAYTYTTNFFKNLCCPKNRRSPDRAVLILEQKFRYTGYLKIGYVSHPPLRVQTKKGADGHNVLTCVKSNLHNTVLTTSHRCNDVANAPPALMEDHYMCLHVHNIPP